MSVNVDNPNILQPVWKADTKTLTSIVNAVGAKAGAANMLKFHMTTDYSVSEATAKIEVSGSHLIFVNKYKFLICEIINFLLNRFFFIIKK